MRQMLHVPRLSREPTVPKRSAMSTSWLLAPPGDILLHHNLQGRTDLTCGDPFKCVFGSRVPRGDRRAVGASRANSLERNSLKEFFATIVSTMFSITGIETARYVAHKKIQRIIPRYRYVLRTEITH